MFLPLLDWIIFIAFEKTVLLIFESILGIKMLLKNILPEILSEYKISTTTPFLINSWIWFLFIVKGFFSVISKVIISKSYANNKRELWLFKRIRHIHCTENEKPFHPLFWWPINHRFLIFYWYPNFEIYWFKQKNNKENID